jgi:serine/threonine protein kinase
MSTFPPIVVGPPAGPHGDPRVGTVLRGKYRLDRVIGAGGMAVVYKATHRNHAEFAVKMLHPQLSIREDIRSRFIREGYAANTVKHPGAVLVVDDDVADDGAAFLVMELLDGLSCDHLWNTSGRTISVELASAIAIQVLDVLEAAHEKGIVHRDVKPANIFMTRAGVVKVLDFGIARTREAIVGGGQVTTTGMNLGTPAFMAPEHARGRTREVDGRTDLWAVGATFFSMVTGQLVHEAETPNEFLIAAGTKPARSLAAALPGAPEGLVAVVDRALAFEKADRWQAAGDMRDALRGAHELLFGKEDPRAVVAKAVAELAPPPPRPDPLVSPAAETQTFPPMSSSGPGLRASQPASGERVASDFGAPRTPTERLSTSAAMSRDRDREPMLPRSSRWALGVGSVVVAAAAFVAGTWILSHRTETVVGDGGAREKGMARDGTVTTSTVAEPPAAPPVVPAPMISWPSASPTPTPIPIPAPSASTAQRASVTVRRVSSADAGAPAANCSPPWFFDPAGHKQYKPECL